MGNSGEEEKKNNDQFFFVLLSLLSMWQVVVFVLINLIVGYAVKVNELKRKIKNGKAKIEKGKSRSKLHEYKN